MLSKKSFGGNKRNFLKLLMRFVRSDVRDHIASQKIDYGHSYRHYGASQRRSSPKITICEIFGVVRFSTFSTASVRLGRTRVEHIKSASPPRTRHLAEMPVSRMGPIPHSCAAAKGSLFDHLVGLHQDRRWDRQAERFRGLEVNDQLELR